MFVERRIDTRALDGLRGIAMLHVIVGHFIGSGCPSVEMTLFYLLSGYSLTLAYGVRRNTDDGSFLWQTVWFYWNRFVRTAPSFYLSNIAAFLISFNSRTLLLRKVKFITTLTISNSWFKPYTEPYIPFNGPSWTISTMTMMYLVFPVLLPLLRKLSDASLAKSLVILYYVQLAPVWYMFHYDYTRTLPISRHPLVRMPVFVMGIIAGLQKLREVSNEKFSDPNLSKPFLHDIIPWGITSSSPEPNDMDEETRTRKWRARIYGSFILIAAAVSYFFTKKFTYKYHGFAVYILGNYGLVHLQLLLVQGLVADRGHSVLGKFLRTQPLIFVGRISMAAYLYHIPVYNYLNKYHGFVKKNRFVPTYVVAKFSIVFLVATIATICIEEPLRNLLKKTKKLAAVGNVQSTLL